MPKVTIWVREQDFKKWSLIKNKPQFISDAIQDNKIGTLYGMPVYKSSDLKENQFKIDNQTFKIDDPTYTDPEEAA